ncbi:hypothetical protein COV93_07640 [Candidatus Woesearchaeota archaeon CG11_big_fil_rev_8_21_14_0_20_43_8]|nr:MAG: hypothetical protein COV93_07640 [Candidatus Woesearchaeota archaeon CG11_big_fil_rev_8_21_14_0_20_43_8]PIO06669.1 MAG: hypothetical protein COT47_03255 [Candidatus Woesearchaeota archaeon CG08_land_8_20_14_0_20_43_7]
MSEFMSFVRSARAFFGSLPKNLSKKVLKPDMRVNSVADIDVKYLKRKGMTHIFFDMDNTITSFHGAKVPQSISKRLKELCRMFKVYIMSNSDSEHVKAFIKRNPAYLLNYMEMGGRKKPAVSTFEYVLKKSGALAKNCVMVGDRYFTDIAGAKKSGFGLVIKTMPLLQETEPLILKAVRGLERGYVRLRRIR